MENMKLYTIMHKTKAESFLNGEGLSIVDVQRLLYIIVHKSLKTNKVYKAIRKTSNVGFYYQRF